MKLGFDGSYLSQEVFIVGFPLSLAIDAKGLNQGYPLPLVKRGIISYFAPPENAFLVDAINNRGLSGGPVIRPGPEPVIIGVISAYRNESLKVMNGDKDTGLVALGNSGMLQAIRMDAVLAMIRKTPIGLPLKP